MNHSAQSNGALIQAAALVSTLAGCVIQPRPKPPPVDPAIMVQAARTFYAGIERSLRSGDRAALLRLFSADGLLMVLDGVTTHYTPAALDSLYGPAWQPPAYFAWDSLRFEVLPPDHLAVLGEIRWLDVGARDTLRYLYVGLIRAVDSGFAIRIEHETRAP